VIRIQARDDVKVNRVSVVIADAQRQIVEQGLAQSDAIGLWWAYTTMTNCPTASATVVAHVEDLTGHGAEREEKKG
jgi:hypothetical protein